MITEFTELNHYTALTIEEFLYTLGYKIVPLESNFDSFEVESQFHIKHVSEPIMFTFNNKEYWISSKDLECHQKLLARYKNFKDSLASYQYGYINGTMSPYVKTGGMMSANAGEGYILWVRCSYKDSDEVIS